MVLQNLSFPKKTICEETELYFHVREGEALVRESELDLRAGTEVDFFTYFNSFSLKKWQTYTRVKKVHFRLESEGECELRCEETDGIFYAVVRACEDMTIYGGCYESEAAEAEGSMETVNLAIGICTFRREEFVKKTLDGIQTCVLENERSPLRGHLHVYVSDNARTLPAEELSGACIHILPNNNAGGAGGFGRCMLEAVHDRERYGHTHILLMDDDIVLEPESLLRTYTFLCLLKPAYRGYMLGGALLRLDIPYIQHANGELWQGGRIGFTKRGYDLRLSENVVRNEEELPMDYNGWWYCCVPLGEDFRGFPLPVFVHGDDIEYGLRFDGKILTLNGIGVWHDAFDNRKASSMEYYDMRNTLIACAVHHPEFSALHMIKSVCRHLIGQMLHCRERDQVLTMKGVEDFCQGVRFLKETEPSGYHGEIMKLGYAMTDMSEDLERLGVDCEETKPKPGQLYLPEGFSKRHLLSINGWLLPGKKETIALPMGAHPNRLYRCKRAILYDPDTAKGFYVERKRRSLFVTLGRCLKMVWLLIRCYRRTVNDFQKNGDELIGQSFWEEYTK